MNIANARALLISAMIATSAMGAVTTTVVDVPTRDVTQRFLYLHPDAPAANLVALPGGVGALGIQNDGTMTDLAMLFPSPAIGRRLPIMVWRSRSSMRLPMARPTISAMCSKSFATCKHATMFRPGSSAAVPRPRPIANLAVNLPADMPVGAIFFSPRSLPIAPLVGSIKRPTFVVYHALDPEQFGAAMFAALTSAPVREQVSFTGGNNGGMRIPSLQRPRRRVCGRNHRLHRQVQRHAGPPRPRRTIRASGSIRAESGWGINFAHQGDVIFASWFTYDLTGKGTWLVMTAAKTAPGTYTGQLFQGTGPAFDAVPFPPLGSPGGATVSGLGRHGDDHLQRRRTTPRSLTPSPASRRPKRSRASCWGRDRRQSARSARSPISRWRPTIPICGGPRRAGSEAGWGINLTHQGDIIFASWFTFDHDRTPMWLVVQANKTAPGTYTGTQVYRLTGPAFNAVPFPAIGSIGGPTGTIVGTASFSFSDGNSAMFSYTVNGVTQTKAITREVFTSPGTVCQ